MRYSFLSRAVSMVVVFLLGAGCSTHGGLPLQPETVLKEYADAVEKGNYAKAYEMMSPSFRRQVDMKEFIRLQQRNRLATKSIGSLSLKRPSLLIRRIILRNALSSNGNPA